MAMVVRNLFFGDPNLEEDLKLMREKAETLLAQAADITTEVTNAELNPGKKRKREVDNWMQNVQELNIRKECIEAEFDHGSGSNMRNKILKIINEIEETLDRGAFHNGLTIHDPASSSLPLLTTDMKGQQFESNLTKILSWLVTDEVYMIGVYGIGGVGKTTLATHIHNKLLRVPDKSATVCWVTVSQKCTTWELQHKIVKALNLPKEAITDLEEADEKKRSAILSDTLKKKRENVDHVVIILDDVWNHFRVEEVGLPMDENGCKLLLTSRSLDVCRRMQCKEVSVNILSEEESWSLFTEQLGNYDDLSLEAKEVARLVAKECDGLPLAIRAVSASMRGIYDVYEWNSTLDDLKDPTRIHEGLENEVFPSLQLSFSRLNKELQNCFLSCALYPEDDELERGMLVNHWIMEGHLDEIQSRQKRLEKAHTIYNKLVSACLLEVTGNCVKMHDLIRDMGIRILSQRQPVIIKAGMHLEEVPRLQEWTKELTKVSLVSNDIREIPSGMTPRCPNLSSLLLRHNPLMTIPNSFFQFLSGLMFLDLSWTRIKRVPNSISYLKNLRTLNINHCRELVFIPSLAKLAKLRHLDLNGCYKLENLPQGMQELVNLECLILQLNHHSTVSFSELITKLSKLQCLELGLGVKEIQIIEMQQLGRLERLIRFIIQDKGDFNIYINSQHFRRLTSYQLLLGDSEFSFMDFPQCERSLNIKKCPEIEGGALQLPDNTQELKVERCHFQMRSLIDALPSLTGLTRLTRFEIYGCSGLECIWSESSCAKPALENLEVLILESMLNLRALAKGRVELPLGSLSNLKKLEVINCNRMEKLFTPCLLKGQLQHLQEIEISNCYELREIFTGLESDVDATEESGEVSPVIMGLPKLRLLTLGDLPNLTSICKNGLICCETIQEITVMRCWKLKQLSLSLQVREDGVPLAPPCLQKIEIGGRMLWESLRWDNPLFKDTLEPFLT